MKNNGIIVWTAPSIPSWNHMFMLEAITFKVCVRVDVNLIPDSLRVQTWTNIYQPENVTGCWHGIDLPFLNHDPESSYERDENGKEFQRLIYGKSVLLTGFGIYQFTFRARHNSALSEWTWTNAYQSDGVVNISPPTEDKWTQGPDFNHIVDSVHLGNFIAATKAEELGFDAVLNVADNLDLVLEPNSKLIYKKIPMDDGAHNPIEDSEVKEAVDWLISHEKQKILVNCRAGIGRAGSIVVSYVFYRDPHISYEEAYKFVFGKRFIYPHKGLKDTLYRLYPR